MPLDRVPGQPFDASLTMPMAGRGVRVCAATTHPHIIQRNTCAVAGWGRLQAFPRANGRERRWEPIAFER